MRSAWLPGVFYHTLSKGGGKYVVNCHIFYTVSQKTILTLHANYNVNAHQPIMVIFGRVVASVRFVEGVGGV